MLQKKLTREFFDKPTLRVAKELLGKFLVRKIGKKVLAAMITETEAYCGPKDLASHASRGRTKRTEIMFGPPGHAYIYLIYGMYHCFNIVTERNGYPSAVLIRAIDAVGVNGPGKVCRYFQIDRTLNNDDLTKSNKLWVEDRLPAQAGGIKIKPSQIKRSPRIGIDYAGKYKNKPWRFSFVTNNH